MILKRTFVLSILLVISILKLKAYSVEIGGLNYDLDEDNKTAVVLGRSNNSTIISIPSQITCSNVVYAVTSIGANAFYYCWGLTSIDIPNSVTSIEDRAFSGCWGLTSIDIPNSVTSIGDYAFSDCSGITSITIPNSVTSIGYWAFSTGLTSLKVEADNKKYDSRNGCNAIIETATNTLITGCKNTVIPYGITSIGDYAFSDCSGLTSIDIPNSVTSIGYCAFSECSGLTSIDIPNSVTRIGYYAFSKCSGLTSITIPNSVTSIGYYAFSECSGLTSITIPNSVTSIGGYAFSRCSGLTSIDIPNSVTSIGEYAFDRTGWLSNQPDGIVYAGSCVYTYKGTMPDNTNIQIKDGTVGISGGAFYDCAGLTSITIPNSVTTIGRSAFSDCTGLTSIYIPNSVTSIGDDAFSGTSLDTVYINSNALLSSHNLGSVFGNQVKAYVLGEGVTGIRDFAFSECSGLTSITIPNSVTSIGARTFSGCIGLTSITIPNNVTSIGNYAFSGCSSLDTVYINSNALLSHSYTSSHSLGSVFGNQVKAYVLGEGVTSIGDWAFSECSGLTFITIPNSVTSIGNNAFSWTSLDTVYINSNALLSHSYTSSHNLGSVFGNQVKAYVFGEGVTSIGDNAFDGCRGLTSITVPNSVTSIGYNAFSGCSSLDTVYINSNALLSHSYTSSHNLGSVFGNQVKAYVLGEGVTSIGDYAFYYCNGLTSIDIPKSVTSIGDYAFSECSGLTSIDIPNSVTSIGDYAFSECSGLTSIDIPNSVTTIGAYAFWDDVGLSSITIPNSVTSIGDYAFYWTGWYNNQPDGIVYAGNCVYIYKGTMPDNTNIQIKDGTVGIAQRAFSRCTGLTSITIPNSVTTIGSSAFSECSSLTSITIPNSVTSIGDYAFSGCGGLTSINIPNSVTNIGGGAFSGCIGLTSIKVVVDNTTYDSRNDCNAIIETATNKLITGCKNTVIPYDITSIGDHAFSGCRSLTSITIPNSVTSIGDYAFSYCSGLTYIDIPNSVTSIGVCAFDGCMGLTSIAFPNSVTRIGDYAFYGCTGLTSIDIPNSVTSIGDYAFYRCSGLTSIAIPNSVTSIGSYAFSGCSGLTSLAIPNSVTSIGNYAFSKCTSLISIIIPNSITSIEEGAFSGCRGLTSIDIPNSVTSIKGSSGSWYSEGAFSGCSGLTSINIPNSVTNIGGGTFSGCSSLDTVYINSNALLSRQNLVSVFGNQVKALVLGEGVTSIEDNALDGFRSLTYIDIPSSVTCIGDRTFLGRTGNLTSIIVKPGNTVYDSRNDCNAIIETATNTLITGCKNTVIPYGISRIGYDAFYRCSGLTSINIPNSVTCIEDRAFYGCSGLTSINISNSVTCIGDSAFRGCTSLTSINIPNSVTSIGDRTFSECAESVTFINVEPGNTVYDSRNGCNAIIETETNTIIAGCINTVIPNGITKIGIDAFLGCTSLTTINIPNSVTSIGYGAFCWCSGLTSINIPNSVTSIEGYAFMLCSSLTSITIPNSVTSIGDYAFYGTGWLNNQPDGIVYAGNCIYTYKGTMPDNTNIQIKDGTVGIAERAFSWCSGLTSIDIPNSVTSIGENAFYGTGWLNNQPDGIVYAGNWVYTYKGTMPDNTNIQIKDGTVGIAGGAFSGCSGLTSITIPNSVTSVGDNAFFATSLDTVYINSSALLSHSYTGSHNLGSVFGNKVKGYVFGKDVSSIGEYAFYNCSGFTFITIPSSITSLGDNAFSGTSLDTVYINSNALLSHSFTSSHNLGSAFGNKVKGYVFGKDVSSIGEYAFYNCSGITSITIPSSITSIGDNAFSCSSIDTVTINSNALLSHSYTSSHNLGSSFGNQVKAYVLGEGVSSIGDSAFYNCSGFSSITIPSNVTNIGDDAFSGTSLDTVYINSNALLSHSYTSSHNLGSAFGNQVKAYVLGEGVSSIGEYAFYDCSGITSITIPSSVTSIVFNAFDGCIGLTSINVEPGNTKYDSRNGCNAIIETAINTLVFGCKNTVIPYGVTGIGDRAFSGCSVLTSIDIPNSVTNIGGCAFYKCSGITSITIPSNVTNIGDDAFSGTSLDTVTINSNALLSHSYTSSHNLGSSFGNQVKAYVFGEGVTSIGEYAFYDCSGITSITIPSSVTNIGDNVFSGTSIDIVYINSNALLSHSYTSSHNLGSSFGNQVKAYVFGEGVSSIGEYAFYDCSGITSITIPSSVTSIGDNAFSCSSIDTVTINSNALLSHSYTSSHNLGSSFGNQVKAYVFGEGVTSIGEYAFYDCSGITSITFPSSVTSIVFNAFDGCIGLTSINVEPGNTKYDSRNGCNAIIETATNTLVFGCKKTVIPYGVTGIGDSAFNNCSGLTSMSIPNSVTSIGDGAFSGCSGLTSISIPNSVTSIGNYAFSGCSGFHSISIPNSVTSIGDGVFSDCGGLIWLTIPNSITSIGDYSFQNCTNLTLITIPDSVTCIGNYAFKNCKSLISITIPNSVQFIGDYSFSDCSSLETISLGAKLSSIGAKAFSGCTSLTEIKSFAIIPPLCGIQALYDINVLKCVLIVPKSSIDNYRAADQWRDFYNIIVNAVFQVSELVVDVKMENGTISVSGMRDGDLVLVYDLNGKIISSKTAINGSAELSITHIEKGTQLIIKIGNYNRKIMVL